MTFLLKIKSLLLVCIIVLLMVTACSKQGNAQITVSAAANLIPAFKEIANQFEAATGIEVVYNFGSSGKLAQQIERGAPVDVFAAANEEYVTRLATEGWIDPASQQLYARGRLVMWSRDATLLPPSVANLNDPRVDRIAIANPEHAPYGELAKTVLQNSQLWDILQPRLVMGNDVRQTLTYAQSGDVTVALVPLSLVINLNEGAYHPISDSLNPTISQAIGIVKSTANPAEAQQFVDFVLSDAGQQILIQYGYDSAAK